ncbi:MAG: hypothetical protein LBU73_09330 [Helicobacteraceae bacterium]|jgi:hypothetical protein|nr:hypothetical protein [Helicobacteraceae bacterium]
MTRFNLRIAATLFAAFFAALFVVGCASRAPTSYDSFSHRATDFEKTTVTLSEKGLSKEAIQNILATKFPPKNKTSVAVIFLYSYDSYNAKNNDLSYYIMDRGKNINYVEKLVPVPRVFIPYKLTFDVIQELGIRSLCEYTLIFYNNSRKSMTFSQWVSGEFKFESDIEFLLIDNQTTAIIASDRLYSNVIKKSRLLSAEDIEEAEDEIYTLQAKLLVEKLNLLFKMN